MKRVLFQTAGCLATSLALGIVEASRLTLWNYGFSNSVWADGVNYILVATLLNLPLVVIVYILGRWLIPKTAFGRAHRESGRGDLGLFLSTFIALSLLLIIARSLIFAAPAAALLFIGGIRLLAGQPRRRVQVVASGLAGILAAWAIWGLIALPNVRLDYDFFIRKAPLRKITQPGKLPPHILFIVVDTLRSDHLNAYGYSRDTSPVISRLAREGVRFAEFRANSNETSQTVASLLTGRYPSGHGLLRLGEPLPEGSPLLPEILQKRGYNTAFLTTHWFIDGRHNFERGADYTHSAWEAPRLRQAGVQQLFVWLKLTAVSSRTSDWLKWLDTKKNDYLVPLLGLPSMESADRFADKVLGFMDYATGRGDYNPDQNRFFLFLFFHDLHWPRCLPKPYHRMYDPEYNGPEICRKEGALDVREAKNEVARYNGALRFVDGQVGRLLEKMKSVGWLDQSLVVITSDHGEKFGAGGEFGHGGTMWENLVRIPLILWQPSRWKNGQSVGGVAEQVDLMPTLLDLLRIPHPAGIQGRSLLTERGSFPAATNRSTAFGEAEMETGGHHYLLRDGWKLLLGLGRPNRLFNLKTDPGEKKNLYGRQPRTGDMEKALKQRIQRARRAAPKGL
jgi:arylsulfatase A-like enzyme